MKNMKNMKNMINIKQADAGEPENFLQVA